MKWLRRLGDLVLASVPVDDESIVGDMDFAQVAAPQLCRLFVTKRQAPAADKSCREFEVWQSDPVLVQGFGRQGLKFQSDTVQQWQVKIGKSGHIIVDVPNPLLKTSGQAESRNRKRNFW